jgi:CD80-like C2-set immunoglobulin domain
LQADGTYETQSELRFKATRHENGQTLTCEATNAVLTEQKERPLKDTVNLEVLCEYLVIFGLFYKKLNAKHKI